MWESKEYCPYYEDFRNSGNLLRHYVQLAVDILQSEMSQLLMSICDFVKVITKSIQRQCWAITLKCNMLVVLVKVTHYNYIFLHNKR